MSMAVLTKLRLAEWSRKFRAAEKEREKSGPPKGFVRNPLLKYPRNCNCFCGSGLKYKKCCSSKMSKYCPEKDAPGWKKLVEQLKSGELVINKEPK